MTYHTPGDQDESADPLARSRPPVPTRSRPPVPSPGSRPLPTRGNRATAFLRVGCVRPAWRCRGTFGLGEGVEDGDRSTCLVEGGCGAPVVSQGSPALQAGDGMLDPDAGLGEGVVVQPGIAVEVRAAPCTP